ncbi:MAG: hypothetical protein HY909_05430 [Deltaproteobacteria bacterium]|nr:hypothetical protein [Deltaproteobacteria bacterium]
MAGKAPRLTKKERQERFGKGPSGTPRTAAAEAPSTREALATMKDGDHLHCIACGKHLDTVGEARSRKGGFDALWATVRCAHGSPFFACLGCVTDARRRLDEHDRSGASVKVASPWH